jgi:hypothetical protein
MTEPARAIIVMIPEHSLFEYLVGRRVLANVPESACLRGMWIDSAPRRTTRILAMRLEHPSFAPVKPGTFTPRMKARFRRP